VKYLTVRLSAEDALRVVKLRRRGVNISRLVRDEIARQASLAATEKINRPTDVIKVLYKIYARYPDPPGTRQRKVNLTDGKAVVPAIRARLKQRMQP
jgi:hypothetical protein